LSSPSQLPINTAIARKLKELQKEQMKNKDARTRLMNEILTNIKSIKVSPPCEKDMPGRC
jgi:hypothetical protein